MRTLFLGGVWVNIEKDHGVPKTLSRTWVYNQHRIMRSRSREKILITPAVLQNRSYAITALFWWRHPCGIWIWKNSENFLRVWLWDVHRHPAELEVRQPLALSLGHGGDPAAKVQLQVLKARLHPLIQTTKFDLRATAIADKQNQNYKKYSTRKNPHICAPRCLPWRDNLVTHLSFWRKKTFPA